MSFWEYCEVHVHAEWFKPGIDERDFGRDGNRAQGYIVRFYGAPHHDEYVVWRYGPPWSDRPSAGIVPSPDVQFGGGMQKLVQERIAKLGREGWELCSVLGPENGSPYSYVFKRLRQGLPVH